ncbi:MAG: hypothetical protein ACRC9U_02475 [Metamycoplasmataceae bacterium]
MTLEEAKEYRNNFSYTEDLFDSWLKIEIKTYFSDAHSWFIDDAFEAINDFFDDHFFFKILLIIPTYLIVSLIYILSMGLVVPMISFISYCIKKKRWRKFVYSADELCEDQEKLKVFLSQEKIKIRNIYIYIYILRRYLWIFFRKRCRRRLWWSRRRLWWSRRKL